MNYPWCADCGGGGPNCRFVGFVQWRATIGWQTVAFAITILNTFPTLREPSTYGPTGTIAGMAIPMIDETPSLSLLCSNFSG
jgi:hypothetical protein